MARQLLISIFIILFGTLSAQQPGSDGWILKSEKEGVKVYYRKTSGVYELKLSMLLETSTHGLIKMFSEAETYNSWAYKVVEGKMLKKNSETDFYYYVKIDFPWPMSDRDLVMHSKLYQNSDLSIVTSSKAAPKFIPEVKGLVRISISDTKWVLRPTKDGKLFVEYYLHSHPGGSIPDWAVNMAVDVGPLETVKNIRKRLKDPRYQTARLAYIKD